MRVLFVCTGNAGRSQMAEALSRSQYSDRIEASSAGVDPWPDLHPMARKLMAERGEMFTGHFPKHVNTVCGEAFDLVVTIGDRALRECPAFYGDPKQIHWELSDPADADGTPELEEVFRNTLRDIERNLSILGQPQDGEPRRAGSIASISTSH